MKKALAILLALVLCLASAVALAEGVPATVTAQGTATINVTPDSATFTAGVSTQDAQVSAAETANSKAMQAVLDALKAQGVDEKDLQTENFSVSPNYDYSNGSSQMPTGYTVSNSVTVTVRDLTKLGDLLDAAIAAGANNTYGVTFQSSQTSEAYDQALQSAVVEALRKAGVMAKAMSREAGSLVSITETGDSYVSPLYAKSSDMSAGSAVPIENGQLSVTAGVTVVLQLK